MLVCFGVLSARKAPVPGKVETKAETKVETKVR